HRSGDEYERLLKELSVYRAELDMARKDLQQGQADMQETRAALEQVQTEHRQDIDLQNALSERLAASTAENVSLKSRVTQLESELANLTASLAEQQQKNGQLAQERDQLQNTLAGRDQQLTKLKEELQASAAELQQARSGIEDSRQQLAASQAQVKDYQDQLEQLKAVKASLAEQQQKNTTLAKEQKQLQDALAKRDEQLADLEKKLQTTSEELQQANSYREQLDELNTIEASLTEQQQKNATLAKERKQLQAALASRDEELAKLREALQTATTELQQAKSGMDESRQQLAASQAQASRYKTRLDELNARLEEQQQAMLEAKKQMAEIVSARDSLRADLTASTEELTRVQTSLESALAQAEQLRQAAAGNTAQPTPAAAVEVAALESPLPVAAETETAPQKSGAEQLATTAGGAVTDSDGDGVADATDLCPATAQGVAVGPIGCAAGATIPLQGVNFRYNSHELTAGARRVLDRVAAILADNPDIRLEVAGHTDSQGNPVYNQWLSQQRAQAVRDYLVKRGLDRKRITARGYGDQQPVADNTTVAGLVQNRRVELRSLP
ncbi:MAG TPA: hypothetical protein ENK49_08900, partial [Gammaproteobacteria bacterium]|nr:hypothetical protein [Gammaproteobacteria bacterium]